MNPLLYLFIGLAAGIFGGFFGIGGGIVMVPVLVFLVGLTQHQAQGTALAAMVPCVTIFAALKYYNCGNIKLFIAIFMSMGLLLGGFIGANFANVVPGPLLKKGFGALLLFASVRMIFFK